MKRYHLYLDGKGYLIVPNSFSVTRAPLFGAKFSSGFPSYDSLDFWQHQGATDWQRGHGQEYHVDPAKFQASLNLEVQDVPGQITLARAPEEVIDSSTIDEKITAKKLILIGDTFYTYLGTESGKIYALNHSTESLQLVKDTETSEAITDFFTYPNSSDSTKLDIYACIPDSYTWRKDGNTGTWAATNITGLRKAAVWGTEVFGSFGLTVKRSTDPTQIANWSDVFTLSNENVRINNLLFAHQRIYIGTYTTLYFWQGLDPVPVYDFSWVASQHNFSSLVFADNYVWFNIYDLGIHWTDSAVVGATSIHKDNKFINFSAALDITNLGPVLFCVYKDTSGNYYLAKSKYRHYWFTYINLSQDSLLSSYLNILYFFNNDGSIDKIDYDSTSPKYQTSGWLISSDFDMNLITLEKLVNSLIVYHRPLTEGQSVTLRANFDSAYTNSQRASWVSGSLSYSSASNSPGFSLNFLGYKHPNKAEREGGLLSQRFRYAVELSSDGEDTPVVEDVFWEYYLERPPDKDANYREFQFTILLQDNLEKLDGEIEDDYQLTPRTAKDIHDDLISLIQKKGIISFVGPSHQLTKAFRLAYNGAQDSCLLTIDQVNNRLMTSTGDPSDDLDIDLTDSSYDTIGELVSYLNSLSNYSCSIDDEIDSSVSSTSLLPVTLIDIKTTGTGKLFYSTTDLYKVIITGFSTHHSREYLDTLDKNQIAGVFQVRLREV